MDLERYEYERKRTYKEYFFYSDGPKGHVLKVVHFILVYAYPNSIYHLVFGDWNEKRNAIDDLSVTNNGDAEKVFATVATIVVDFIDIFRNAMVYAEGSTPARTRLYQITLSKFLHEIEPIFQVYGDINKQQLEPFQKNANYKGFLIARKEYIILEEQTETYMTSSNENKEEKKRIYNDRTIDGPELVDIDNDPVVLRKMEAARKRFEEHPVPEWILKKHNLL